MLRYGVGNRKMMHVLENSGWVSIDKKKKNYHSGEIVWEERVRKGAAEGGLLSTTAALCVSEIHSLVIFKIRFIGTPSPQPPGSSGLTGCLLNF